MRKMKKIGGVFTPAPDGARLASGCESLLKKRLAAGAIQYLFAFVNVGFRGGVNHRHDAFELVYHAGGEGKIEYRDQCVSFASGSWSLVGPGVYHRQLNREGFEDLCLTFKLDGETDFPAFHLEIPAHPRLASAAAEMRMLAACGQAGGCWKRLELNCRTGIILAALMGLLESSESAPAARSAAWYAEQAERMIRQNGFTDLRIGEIARQLHVTPDHLRHCYRLERNESLKCFLSRVRLEYADQLLTYSELTLKEIADRCGFGSESHFGAAYRRVRGISPGRKRK